VEQKEGKPRRVNPFGPSKYGVYNNYICAYVKDFQYFSFPFT